MSRLFKFSNEFEGIEMRFKDKNIEKKYFITNNHDENKKCLIFCIFSISIYIIAISINLARSGFQSNRALFILSGGLILDIVHYQITKKWNRKLKVISLLKKLRFICLYSILTLKL